MVAKMAELMVLLWANTKVANLETIVVLYLAEMLEDKLVAKLEMILVDLKVENLVAW